MNPYARFFILPILALTTVLAGCYPQRMTGDYKEYPELGNLEDSAFNGISARTPEEEAERVKRLETLEGQSYPEYRIDANDILKIKVYNHPDLETLAAVTPDGSVSMMFTGQIKVAGNTIPDAERKIQDALSVYLKNPVVSINPQEVKSQLVTISGAIRNPGTYPVYDGMRVSDLYALAGGSSVRENNNQVMDAADLHLSIFIRGKDIIDIDFSEAIEKGNRLNNIKLQKGDYIYIAVRSETMVSLIGEVVNPHQRVWNRNLSFLELIAAGGGLKETYWENAVIIRGGFASPKLYRLNIDSVLKGKKANILLHPGDIVYIPKDNAAEYNVFVRKLMPTAQFLNMLTTPVSWYMR